MAERAFNFVQGIANRHCQLLAFQAMNHVLVITRGKFGAAAERLPKPDRWDVQSDFISHTLFDSGGSVWDAEHRIRFNLYRGQMLSMKKIGLNIDLHEGRHGDRL